MPTADAAINLTASLIADKIMVTPDAVFGLATGRTMERVYEKLAGMGLDFSFCTTFNLDEYVGLPPENKNSYRYYMDQKFFDRINIKKENTHLPNGMALDFKKESELYERMIIDSGGIDIQLLGIGSNGHIGFNEPLSALLSRTREKALTPETIAQNESEFADRNSMPKRALTMGVGTIIEAKRIILLAMGRAKANIIAKAVEGPISSMISATALQLHQCCTVIVDEEAGSELQGKSYYKWIFQNEPEWSRYR